ncbi:hypothetical protein TCT1_23840 [Xenorhabdus sp. TCT-1]|uniref:AntA/AntB antirepressor domain-containing protein n=1 Tax=Xenorhabdus taiwanensis TaxID=3085177 RepID=A0ABN7C539_9GAMM|nr:hypothetical protein TCT1_23840 [Xenorhabdus sp. TCT-1]
MEYLKSGLNATGQTRSKFRLGDITATTFADVLPVIQSNINGRAINCVSAKALHEVLGVRRDFSSWIDGRITEYGFIKNVDFSVL